MTVTERPTPLTSEQVAAALQLLPGWYMEQGRLVLSVELVSFSVALDFVQRVGELADLLNHHPDIDVRWRTVTLRVDTHEAAGAITERDLELAASVLALPVQRLTGASTPDLS